eukprot:407704-Rhodomonas_salina.1
MQGSAMCQRRSAIRTRVWRNLCSYVALLNHTLAHSPGHTVWDDALPLPPGYQPLPEKTAKLKKSLYGLQQAPMAWHALIEAWMLKYGFKPIGQDRVTFLLNHGKSTILLLLYVVDGICATNNVKLYKQFLKDLS